MPPDWLRIKEERPDLTDYLIHSTRPNRSKRKEAFEVLMDILSCGYLKPAFGERYRKSMNNSKPTIRGDIPAACFTEQPLGSYLISHRTLHRYSLYGIAVRKSCLFEYGGRPVVYGDESQLAQLPDSLKYLWVNFQPIPNDTFGGYPLDWTHEREWRCALRKYHYGSGLGQAPSDGIPLLLPPSEEDGAGKELLHLPWIFVATEEERDRIESWLLDQTFSGTNGVLKAFFETISSVPVIAMKTVEKNIQSGDRRWERLDTVPYEEYQPEKAEKLTKLGWRELKG